MERFKITEGKLINEIMHDKSRLLEDVELEGVKMKIGRAFFNTSVHDMLVANGVKYDKGIHLWVTEYKLFTAYKQGIIDDMFLKGHNINEVSLVISYIVDIEDKLVSKSDIYVGLDLSYTDFFELCSREKWIEDMIMKDHDLSELTDVEIFDKRKELFSKLMDYVNKNRIEPFYSMFNSGLFKAVDFMSTFLFVGKRPDPINGGLLPVKLESSWARGIQKLDDYHVELVTARMAIITSKRDVATAGSFSNNVINVNYRNTIRTDDYICDTINFIEMEITEDDYNRMKGMYVMKDNKPVMLSKDDIGTVVHLRSPLTCNCRDGICKWCAGEYMYQDNKYKGHDIILQMIKDTIEEITQASLSAKHSSNAQIIPAELSWDIPSRTPIESILKLEEGAVIPQRDDITKIYTYDNDVRIVEIGDDMEEDEDAIEDGEMYMFDKLYIEINNEPITPIRINSEFFVNTDAVKVIEFEDDSKDSEIVLTDFNDLGYDLHTNKDIQDLFFQFDRSLSKYTKTVDNFLELFDLVDGILLSSNSKTHYTMTSVLIRSLITDKNGDYVDFSKSININEVKINTLNTAIKRAKSIPVRYLLGYYKKSLIDPILYEPDGCIRTKLDNLLL